MSADVSLALNCVLLDVLHKRLGKVLLMPCLGCILVHGKEQCISSLGISTCVCFPACSARFDQVKFIQLHVSYRGQWVLSCSFLAVC